ncbi:MAG: outer membrane lipoprotein carrier protein LolA [Pseudomonadota bacterium]
MRALIAAATIALTSPSFAQDAIPIDDLNAYLNGIRTAEGTFTQVNADGSVSTGQIFLHRPGRVRFEYEADDTLVMAGGGQLAIFDGRSNTPPEQYPLRQTPLSLILARQVDLGRSDMVVAHDSDGTATRILAQDPDRPEIGQIEMVFTGNPVELRQWVIIDEGGSETTVILGGLETGGTLPARLFSIPQEEAARGF